MDYTLHRTIPSRNFTTLSLREAERKMVSTINKREKWMNEIIDYIQDEKLTEVSQLSHETGPKGFKICNCSQKTVLMFLL